MNRTFATALAFVALSNGCGGAPPAQSPPPPNSASVEGCALGMAGARASQADAPNGGVAIIFVAPRTDELRVRARDAASSYGPDARRGLGHEGRHGRGGRHGLSACQLPPSRASVEDVQGGARIELTPGDPADAQRLRQRAEVCVASMNQNCQ